MFINNLSRVRPRALVGTGLILAAALSVGTPVQAVPTTSVSFAVTFDASSPAGWLHTSMTSGAPTGKTLGEPIPRATRSGGSEIIPSDVRAVPGVVGSNKYVGTFPAFSASAPTYSAYTVKPTVFGAKDALAPGTKKFIFGADFKLNTGSTKGTPEDNGNNVVQRGLSPGDQYKLQVDLESGTPSVTCVVRDEGTITSNPPAVPIVAGHWVRARCQRVVAGGGENVTLTVTYPGGEIANPAKSAVTFRPIANLNYSIATSTSPVPLSIGAKVHNAATSVITPDSDQFNGQIDNVYLSIP